MCPNKTRYRKRIVISDEMVNQFVIVIRNVLNNCICAFEPSLVPESEFLLLKTSDEKRMTIGCFDSTYFLLDSDFFYNRFCEQWYLKELEAFGKTVQIPKQSEFYLKLYNKEVLAHGIFHDKPLAKYRMCPNGDSRFYFCISKERLGIYDDIVLKIS